MTTDKAAAPVGAVPQGDAMHDSDCATHNAPAMPAGLCDCTATTQRLMPTFHERPGHYDEWAGMKPDPAGGYVQYDDYAALQAALASQAARMARAEAALERIADMYDDHRAQFEQRQDAYDMADIARTYLSERDA